MKCQNYLQKYNPEKADLSAKSLKIPSHEFIINQSSRYSASDGGIDPNF
jgi:hypothetical protein